MTGAADVLAAGGIVRGGEVVELAGRARLDLACAAVLLVKESGGGRNVWGHDAVATGGAYDKGGEVTRENYTAYRRAVASRTAGRQGCGPTQLTYGPFQDQADAAGGCWDWRANTLTGFSILAGLIRHAGERDGFRRYNGAGPAAEAYADDAVARLARWRALLAGASSSPVTEEDDMPISDQDAQKIADAVWRRPTANGWNDVVAAEQILAGTEVRTADAQNIVHALGDVHDGLTTIDLDKLADAVVDRLAKRLGGV